MSLNDPRWGRSSDEEPRKDERPAEEEPPRRPDDEDHRDHRDDRDDRDDRREDKNRRRDEGDDIDRLWKEFTDMFQGAVDKADKLRHDNKKKSHS